MNNLLNVLNPLEGWQLSVNVLERMKPGDHLIICGLQPEHLAQFYKSGTTYSGLTAYYDGAKFKKTAITPKFEGFISQLHNVDVVDFSPAKLPIEIPFSSSPVMVGGQRVTVIVLQKNGTPNPNISS